MYYRDSRKLLKRRTQIQIGQKEKVRKGIIITEGKKQENRE